MIAHYVGLETSEDRKTATFSEIRMTHGMRIIIFHGNDDFASAFPHPNAENKLIGRLMGMNEVKN